MKLGIVGATALAALSLAACGSGTETNQTSNGSQDKGSQSQGQDAASWFTQNCPTQVKTLTDHTDQFLLVQGAAKPPASDKKNKGIKGNQPFRLYTYDATSNTMTALKPVDEAFSLCLRPTEAKQVRAQSPTEGKERSFSQVSAPNLGSEVYIDSAIPTSLRIDTTTMKTDGDLIPEALWSLDASLSPLDKAQNVGSGKLCELTSCGG